MEEGITQKMLLEQLKELMDYGFVEKKSYEGYPLHVAYLGRKGSSPGLVPTKKWVIYCSGAAAYNIIIKSDWRLSKMNVTSSGIINGVIQPQYGGKYYPV